MANPRSPLAIFSPSSRRAIKNSRRREEEKLGPFEIPHPIACPVEDGDNNNNISNVNSCINK